MVIHVIEVGVDSTSQYPHNMNNEDPSIGLHENLLVLKIVLGPVYVSRSIVHIDLMVSNVKTNFFNDNNSHTNEKSVGCESLKYDF